MALVGLNAAEMQRILGMKKRPASQAVRKSRTTQTSGAKILDSILGRWVPRRRQNLRIPAHRLGAVNRRYTRAHELAHTPLPDNPHFDARTERAADQIAAELLTSPPTEYAAAETIYGPHTGAIARELGVTTHLLAVWRELFERARA